MRETTLFEAIGGQAGVLRLAHAWHERVLADEIVAHAFRRGFHPQHTERLAAYWAEVWGGPSTYSLQFGTESSVVRMHSGNGPHGDMDRRAIACFVQALDDLELDDEELRRVLLEYFTWATEGSMAAYPNSANDVPKDLKMPRWSWDGLQKADSE